VRTSLFLLPQLFWRAAGDTNVWMATSERMTLQRSSHSLVMDKNWPFPHYLTCFSSVHNCDSQLSRWVPKGCLPHQHQRWTSCTSLRMNNQSSTLFCSHAGRILPRRVADLFPSVSNSKYQSSFPSRELFWFHQHTNRVKKPCALFARFVYFKRGF
jgi:hypothetical protein